MCDLCNEFVASHAAAVAGDQRSSCAIIIEMNISYRTLRCRFLHEQAIGSECELPVEFAAITRIARHLIRGYSTAHQKVYSISNPKLRAG
jgi:hypothetical protein